MVREWVREYMKKTRYVKDPKDINEAKECTDGSHSWANQPTIRAI